MVFRFDSPIFGESSTLNVSIPYDEIVKLTRWPSQAVASCTCFSHFFRPFPKCKMQPTYTSVELNERRTCANCGDRWPQQVNSLYLARASRSFSDLWRGQNYHMADNYSDDSSSVFANKPGSDQQKTLALNQHQFAIDLSIGRTHNFRKADHRRIVPRLYSLANAGSFL